MVGPRRLAINPVSDLEIGSRQMLFCDRIDAGRKLAAALTAYKSEDCVVFALLRGGVPVAAAFLHAPLDLILVRKIGAPNQPELAIGAIVDGIAPIIVKNPGVIKMLGVQAAEFQALCQRELAEIERRRKRYMEDKAPISAKGRIAIVIDDGIATGATMRAALQATRMRGPKKLILAVPVAPAEVLEELRNDADEIVCLESPDKFGAVGLFYEDFEQTTDDELAAILSQVTAKLGTASV